jgi:hypothetical protein
MRKREKRSLNETQQTLLRPLEESEKILSAITTMSTRLGRPLSEERIQQWLRDLANYPIAAIEYAMDNWGRNAKQLPTLADLLTLLRSWAADKVLIETCGKCDSGWVPGGKDKAGNDAVVRCECIQR